MSRLDIPRIIGHRGAKATAPENTLAGIRQAHREGATWVEFDVKLTSDGAAILMHDETLERTTTGKGLVRETSLADIRRLDAGIHLGPQWKGEPVPTLQEALALMADLGMGFNLEVKPCPGREAETARVAIADLKKHWPKGAPPPIVSSFKPVSLAAVREVDPDMALGYLADELPANWQSEFARLGCRTAHLNHRKLKREQVTAVSAAGFPVLVWTVNELERGRELLGWGAAALITDRPVLFGGV
jgi:glycerophosphoryl diester phosphodiesterase